MLKKIVRFQLVFCALVCLSISFWKSDGYAALYSDCTSASVELIGPMVLGVEGTVVATLMNKSGATVGTDWAPNTTRQFFLHTAIVNQGMAALLTAYSMNKTVWVRLVGDAPRNGSITVLYLIK